MSVLSLAQSVPRSGLLFGLMLVAAIAGGYAAHFLHLPRVIGFLLGGAALKAVMTIALGVSENPAAGESLAAAAAPLQPIRDLALGLILFTIGGVFERSQLRAVSRRVMRIGALEMGLTFLFVLVVCAVVSMTMRGGAALGDEIMLALLLGAAAVATAPAATLFVLQEYQAKGSVTDTILGLTAVNNIVCILLFQAVFLALAATGGLTTTGPMAAHLGRALLCSTLGSVLLGLLLGALVGVLHAKLSLSETLLVFFSLFILLGAGEDWFWQSYGASYNFLLTALVAGATFSNVAIDSRKLDEALRTFAAPIFAGFFAMAGYELHVGNLKDMGVLGGAYVVARAGGKWLGCKLGVRWAQEPARVDGRLGSAMLCQAAVVIGLAAFVERNWDSESARRFSTVVLGSVVVFELIGPLLVKRCVVQGGEVKAITLLGRADGSSGEGSAVRVAWHAFVRLFGGALGSSKDQAEDLTVKHIMRTNVQFLAASASFNEVLHHIERSTHADFPVVRDDGEFAGMIHFSDVRDVIYDPALTRLVTAVDLADPDTRTVPMEMPLRALLDLFTRRNVAVLPVVEHAESNRVVGIVEQRDLLRALHLSRASE